MKSTLTLVLSLFVTLSFSQNLLVSSNNKSGINLLSYKTYGWLSIEDDSVGPNSYFLNDAVLRTNIIRAIDAELKNLGFIKSNGRAEIQLKFNVFSAPTRLLNFKSTTKEKQNTRKEIIQSYNADPGTLLISIVDENNLNTLWEGFASGMINSQAAVTKTKTINKSVKLIFASLVNDATSHPFHNKTASK